MPVGGRQRRGIGTGDSQGQSEKEKAPAMKPGLVTPLGTSASEVPRD